MKSTGVIDLRPRLLCPICREKLQWFATTANCTHCGEEYPIVDGIYDMRPKAISRQPLFYSHPLWKTFINGLVNIHEHYYGSSAAKLEARFKRALFKLTQGNVGEVVDIGCGTGSGFEFLGSDENIIGLDIDMALLRRCRSKHPNATLVCCDFTRSPFLSASFETIFSVGSLEHMFFLDSALENMQIMLSRTGSAYVLIPTEGGLAWSLARHLFTRSKNARILGMTVSQFDEVMQISHCNTVFAIDSAIRKFFRVDAYRDWPIGVGGAHANLVRCYRLTSLLATG